MEPVSVEAPLGRPPPPTPNERYGYPPVLRWARQLDGLDDDAGTLERWSGRQRLSHRLKTLELVFRCAHLTSYWSAPT